MEGRLMSLGSEDMKSYLITPHLVALLTGLRDVTKEWPYFYLKLMGEKKKKKRLNLVLPWSLCLPTVYRLVRDNGAEIVCPGRHTVVHS